MLKEGGEREREAKSRINKRPHPDFPSGDINKGFYELDMNYPPWPFTADLLELINQLLPFLQPKEGLWGEEGNFGALYTRPVYVCRDES